MALDTSKLRWPELGSDFKLKVLEIGTPLSESFEKLSAGLRRSPTVSATYSLKLLKIGSKHLLPGSMVQSKQYYLNAASVFLMQAVRFIRSRQNIGSESNSRHSK
jgi:hypothetical protein